MSKQKTMDIIEIFTSIEGEGKRTGLPCTFIRVAGCNLRCSYCDTQYSYDEEAKNATEMTVEQIVRECQGYGVKLVTVTGGEPLAHKNIVELLYQLDQAGFEVNIETNGSLFIKPMKIEGLYKNLFLTMDYKGPSSNMEAKMELSNLTLLDENDVLKFVVGSHDDLETMRAILIKYEPKAEIYVSPIWGQIELEDIANYIMKHKLNNCKIQVQLHKLIWDPNKRGV